MPRRNVRKLLESLIAGSGQRSDPKRGRLLLESLEKRQLLAGDMDLLFTDGDSQPPTTAETSGMSATGASAEAGGLQAAGQAEGEPAPDLLQFALALGDAGVEFFGADWCPACRAQKDLFNDGRDNLPFIEVTNPDRSLNEVGVAEQINQFPTWKFTDGTVLVGIQTLETLSQTSGVTIPQSEQPTFDPIGNQTVAIGSPLHLPIDVYDPDFDPDGQPIQVTVSVEDPNLLEASVLAGNRSIRIDVNSFGEMVFEMFEQRAPRATGRVIELAEFEPGFYDGIIFHRVIDGFVIQGGDPTGTGSGGSSLGDFDDDFHPELVHNREGVLSYAKSADDTNDSQFFITEGPTRHLDFNHSIIGQLVEGFDVREAISRTSTSASRPDIDVVINTIEVIDDKENSVVMLKPTGIATGATNVTITVTDQDGNTHSETIRVTVTQDSVNSQPFLTEITTPAATPNTTPASLQLSSIDVEGDAVTYFAQSIDNPTAGSVSLVQSTTTNQFDPNFRRAVLTVDPAAGFTGSVDIQLASQAAPGEQVTFVAELLSGTASGTVSVDANSGLVTVTPDPSFTGDVRVRVASIDGQGNTVQVYAESISNSAIGTVSLDSSTGASTVSAGAGFDGTLGVLFGVAPGPGVTGNALGDMDTQLVPFAFDGEGILAPTAIDLQTGSDSGTSNIDNVTNSGSLAFRVDGVTSGATVELVTGDGTVIGAAVATGASVVITTNNIAALGDGQYQIAARQTLGNDISLFSPSITIDYDATAPDSVAASASTQGNVGREYVTDLISSEEGSGLVYALSTAPTGATIDATTGVINWTPAEAQIGANGFTIELTDLAGNTFSESFTVNVAEAPLAEIKLELTDLQGNPITSISVGQTFLLNFIGVDARSGFDRDGVFQAYADILFDSSLVRPVPGSSIEYSDDFDLFPRGTFEPGLIDELGAADSRLVASNESESLIATIRMEALASGTVTFRSDPADNVNDESVLLYGTDDKVPTDAIAFGTASLAIGQSFIVNADNFTVAEDSGSTVFDVLLNDQVISGSGTLSVVGITQPGNGGTVTLVDGIVSFAPDTDFFGTAEFTYRVSDSGGVQEDASVTVTVTPVNDPPTAVADSFNVNQDSTGTTLDLIGNDLIDPDDGDPAEDLTISDVGTTSAGGTVTIASDGKSVTYTPPAGFTGTDTFTYVIRDRAAGDATGLTDSGLATVTVSTPDDPPTAVADSFPVAPDTILEDSGEAAYDVLANDLRDADNQAFVIDSVGTPNQGGSVRISSDGLQFFYTPAADFAGTEEVTYTIRDTGGGLSVGTATFTVTGQNDPPPILNTTVGLSRGASETSVFEISDLPANVDAGETLTISTVSTTTSGGGTARIDGSSILYTPPSASFSGTDTISYTIDDGSGTTSSGTITVNVNDFRERNIILDFASRATFAVQGIMLEGTNLLGDSVSVPLTYEASRASFASVLPGSYTIRIPAIPFFQNATAPREIPITSAAEDGDVLVDPEIGGLRPEFMSIRDWLGSASRNSILVAVAPGASSLVAMPSPGASTISQPIAQLDSTGENITIEGTAPDSTDSVVPQTIPTGTDARVQIRGEVDGIRLLKVSDLEFAAAASGPEGEQVAEGELFVQDGLQADNVASTLTVGDVQAEGESAAAASATLADIFVPVADNDLSRTDATVLALEEGELWVGQTGAENEESTDPGAADSVDSVMESVTSELTLVSGAGDEIAENSGVLESLDESAIDAVLSGGL